MEDFVPFDWAIEMLKVVHTVVPVVNMLDMNSSDGCYITRQQGQLLRNAFLHSGYLVFEEVNDFWLVESKADPDVGVTIDFTTKDIVITFFNEAMH